MNFYSVASYNKTLGTLNDLASEAANTLQINPEVWGSRRAASDIGSFGNPIRNFNQSLWPDSAPVETFKEMDISIKKLEVNWK